MGFCDTLIAKAITISCDLVAGVEANGWIVNRDDVDFASSTISDNKVTSLVLKTGKKAYAVAQPPKAPFTGTTTALEEGTYANTFTHNVGLVVLDNSPEVCKDIIDPLANGKFVVILENKFKDIAGTTGQEFQLYGWLQGLSATAIDNDKYSEDTEGGWAITLTETKSPKSAMFVFDTDYATTKAMIEALV